MIKIKSIKLVSFRCYAKKELSFGDSKNIIIGENAVGKTSIVEALSMLGTTKSFRTSIDKDLIKKNGDFYYIDYEIMESNTPKKIEISFDGNKKTIYENKKQLNLII